MAVLTAVSATVPAAIATAVPATVPAAVSAAVPATVSATVPTAIAATVPTTVTTVAASVAFASFGQGFRQTWLEVGDVQGEGQQSEGHAQGNGRGERSDALGRLHNELQRT